MDTTDYFKITIVDEETGRGVPLVELKTTSGVRYYTDSNGIVAFYESFLMDQKVLFYINSHGYEFSEEFFGERGKVLKVTKGGAVLLKIRRLNIAERLYRITGEGIYRDSLLVGQRVPICHPLLNSYVMGQDTVLVTPYKRKLYWFWGDTFGPADFNVAVSGATSEYSGKGGLDPDVGVDLTYFVDKSGFSKKMCFIPGHGRVWIDWLVTITDDRGMECLIARYSRMKNLDSAHERGLAVFNDKTELFEPLVRLNVKLDTPHLSIHPFRASIGGEDYYYFTSGYFFSRVKADLKHISDPKKYESFTCLVPGSRYNKKASHLDRRSDGRLIYAWKANTDPIDCRRQQELVSEGKIELEEGWLHLTDIDTGNAIAAYPGSVFWNDFRKRWIMIAQKDIGEVWYAEADTPVGPWVYSRKIVNHKQYTFYNPTQHPFFDQAGGRIIYFEGTYTNWFSGNCNQTPRYDYNQIMYRLSLDDSRLFLPTPVYRVKGVDGAMDYMLREGVASQDCWKRIEDIAFFAVPSDRRREGLIPIFATMHKGEVILWSETVIGRREQVQPLFYALPAALTTSGLKLSGRWQCMSKDQYGFEMLFTLKMQAEGEGVKAISLQENIVISNAWFKHGKLKLNVKHNETAYILIASLKRGKLTGKWEECSTDKKGIWEGKRVDFAYRQAASSEVIPLFEYCGEKRHTRRYSTSPDLKDKTLTRSPDPICRVWRNPMSLLILDYETVSNVSLGFVSDVPSVFTPD